MSARHVFGNIAICHQQGEMTLWFWIIIKRWEYEGALMIVIRIHMV